MHWWCSICTELLTDMETISITPCGHVFHLECLKKWIITSETCPECRESVSSPPLVKLYPNELSCKETANENYNNYKAEVLKQVDNLFDFGQQCIAEINNQRSKASAYFEEKCKLELQLENVNLQKNQLIESFESKIANLEEINRQLSFENEHLNGVKTIVNGTKLEAEEVLNRYSSNADEENAAKKLASYCSILKCELDRVTGEKKALEFHFEEVKYKYSNNNSKLMQLQKLVEKFKKDIPLLEAEKRDSSGYDYFNDTSCEDEQQISMRDNMKENGVDYSQITVKFAENQEKIGVRIVEDEIPTTSKLSVLNNKKVVLPSSSTLACQDNSITRIVYDDFEGCPSIINRTFKENLPKHPMGKKTKSTFSSCELLSPMSKRKRSN